MMQAAPVVLFDGKTLDGWEGDLKWWKVEDGLIVGGSLTKEVNQNYFIATKKSYDNYDLKLKLKLTTAGGFLNSGVQIRSVRVPGSSEMAGYQVDAGEGWWGKLYDESRRNKVVGESKDPKAVEAAVKKDDWNEYRIRTDGAHIQSWINGVPALDYVEADPKIAQDGAIGVQIHAGGKSQVQVKDVEIDELPPTPNAVTWDKVGRPGDKKPAVAKEGNVTGGTAKTPAEEQASFIVPEGFEVELVEAEEPGIAKFVATSFDQQGRLWTMTALEYPVDGNENPAAANALYANPGKDKVLVYDRDPASPTGFVRKPRVFAEGLAIPLGILPYKNGVYVQHGHDIVFLSDTDGDGKADKREVILTGFGVQDSHLFPHQFTRAPGGWMWMAQGAFNYSKVLRPGQPAEKAIKFDQTRMARFRPDGTQFDITSNGPCNIWGLVINGEGETFIQEANDYGYPVMPFHEYGNYPGCSNGQWKSYAPEFPGTPNMLLGGTGLSGLALTDAKGMYPAPWADVMLVANPITRKINAIKMHRDGPRWKLEKLPDFVDSTDPMFRPVAITIGPDGCLYITDWYNKVISHNEVPRTHPDRDKTHGRIWRVKAKAQKPWEIPNFAKLSDDELLAKLGGESVAQAHIAWQTLADRGGEALLKKVDAIIADEKESDARRIQAMWIRADRKDFALPSEAELRTVNLNILKHPNRNVRREWQRLLGGYLRREVSQANFVMLIDILTLGAKDTDPEVRSEVIRSVGNFLRVKGAAGTLSKDESTMAEIAAGFLIMMAEGPLEEPTAPSTSNGKLIKVGAAYDREFQRYLVRLFLESAPAIVKKAVEEKVGLTVEGHLLATLSLEPKASAAGVAKLLPKLQRPPGKEEILRLLEFLGEPGIAEAVKAALGNPATSPAVLQSLVELRTRLDAAKVAPLVNDAAKTLLAGDAAQADLGIKLASAFKIAATEPQLVGLIENPKTAGPVAGAALKALGELGSANAALFVKIFKTSTDVTLREEALAGLATSKAADAPEQVFSLWPGLTAVQRKFALSRMVSTKAAASAVVAGVKAGTIAKTDIDAALLDRLQAILPNDPALGAMIQDFGALFRPVLALDGSEDAYTQTNLVLDGPMTVESWVRLDPAKGKAGPESGIFGLAGKLDLNFFDAHFRVFVGTGDAVTATKPVTANFWTHYAATRDAQGIWKLYIDGRLDATAARPAPRKIENPRIGWTSAPGGTRGMLANLRVWNRERTAEELGANFDRGLPDNTPGLVLNSASGWGELQKGARVAKTSDFPPVLTAEEAVVMDAKFTKVRALAEKPGDAAKGKMTAAICQACHLIRGQGGAIGPNLSGAGAMGTEALLHNILTPNAAMESAYRIFRVEMKDGSVKEGFQAGEDKDAVVIRTPGLEDQRIARKDIRETTFLRRSLMPEGLLDGLSSEQITDLFAYLKTLK
jgi:putative membrane-bound dehydrogenase-like protein